MHSEPLCLPPGRPDRQGPSPGQRRPRRALQEQLRGERTSGECSRRASSHLPDASAPLCWAGQVGGQSQGAPGPLDASSLGWGRRVSALSLPRSPCALLSSPLPRAGIHSLLTRPPWCDCVRKLGAGSPAWLSRGVWGVPHPLCCLSDNCGGPSLPDGGSSTAWPQFAQCVWGDGPGCPCPDDFTH